APPGHETSKPRTFNPPNTTPPQPRQSVYNTAVAKRFRYALKRKAWQEIPKTPRNLLFRNTMGGSIVYAAAQASDVLPTHVMD
ncbi:MAG: hypothetical protein LIQ31_02510, partial [Planctomycetes bacterium]|nr:hypothetical protein [Planctomycetota bacterium]